LYNIFGLCLYYVVHNKRFMFHYEKKNKRFMYVTNPPPESSRRTRPGQAPQEAAEFVLSLPFSAYGIPICSSSVPRPSFVHASHAAYGIPTPGVGARLRWGRLAMAWHYTFLSMCISIIMH
jgi:hypothetical protein